MLSIRAILACTVLLLAAAAARAHPMTKDSRDRTIVVRVKKTDAPNRLRVRVEYRLEVFPETVIDIDMKPYREEVNADDYFPDRPLEYYRRFAKIYEGMLAERLSASANGKPLPAFRCVERKPSLVDENGMSLGHLRCDFVFESAFDIDPERKTDFTFKDDTYYLEAGKIALSFVNESGLPIVSITAPDDALLAEAAKRPMLDDDRLRRIEAVFAASAAPPTAGIEPPTLTPLPREDRFDLRRLVRQSEYGVALTLLLAFAFGAVHALTPGHGKTLVAAYLVGERGTIWHALYLGVVTTLTHTGALIGLAGVILLLPEEKRQTFEAWLAGGLGLLMGLIVTGMGFWLLLQRLAGRPDHVHLGGGHHHHSHSHASAEPPAPRSLSWWGLTLLGITGGMIPCADGIGVLLYAIAAHQFWFVLPAILAFSAGLAAVLVAIGILVVQVPRFAGARAGNSRWMRALPIASAIAVTLMGFWLCFEAVRGN